MKTIDIPARLHNVALDGNGKPIPVTGADEIYDDALSMTQATINANVQRELDDLSGRREGITRFDAASNTLLYWDGTAWQTVPIGDSTDSGYSVGPPVDDTEYGDIT